jgi:hypothetical protein
MEGSDNSRDYGTPVMAVCVCSPDACWLLLLTGDKGTVEFVTASGVWACLACCSSYILVVQSFTPAVSMS